MEILSLSDKIIPFIYSSQVKERYKNVDLIIGCGDLPYYYLEFVISMLDKPLFFVRGNHDKTVEHSQAGPRKGPEGGEDLHAQVIKWNNIILAGIEGSLCYSKGNYQYTQLEMWSKITSIIPRLFSNRILYGRYLDVFITHAPPTGIHDQPDLPHQGIDAFRWFLKVFKPGYHFHGHIHIYTPDENVETLFGSTKVINTYGFRVTYITNLSS